MFAYRGLLRVDKSLVWFTGPGDYFRRARISTYRRGFLTTDCWRCSTIFEAAQIGIWTGADPASKAGGGAISVIFGSQVS